jgi:hypothetical protein
MTSHDLARSPRRAAALLLGLVTLALGCGPRVAGGDDDDPGDCLEGVRRCSGASLQRCQDGRWTTDAECPDACDSQLGCVLCVPGTGTCSGDTSTACRPDGQGYFEEYCDPVQGMSCGASGICEGACSSHALGQTYFGCDYWPTVTGNIVAANYDYAVVVANTTGVPATITIDGGALGAPDVFTVPADSAVVRTLPWVAALKLCLGGGQTYFDCYNTQTNGALALRGAYHLRSSVPVTVYQFNPLQYTKPGMSENSYTNDASLLFPTNAWRNDHYVTSWQATAGVHPSLMAVTAYQDGTEVTITTAANTPAAGGAPAFTAGAPQAVTLNAGDVIQLATTSGDLTGSRVVSSKPVQVIGGHYCANVPDGFGYCDHLEEVMLSVEALGGEYVIASPAVTTIPNGKEQMVRIVAIEPDTTLSYDPPQAGFPTSIAAPGQWVEIARQSVNYHLTANKKILVAQYMEGSTAGGGTGDPAMALAVPVDQFRREYLFHAPINYTTNYVDIIAPLGATVVLDGAPVLTWQPIGSSPWQLARITPLGNGPLGDGNHKIVGDEGFGISVYGYGQDTSYWYPGGLDLKRIVVE